MHMGGVYNGEGGTCHRGNIPCPLAVQMKTAEVGRHTYELDMHTGENAYTHVCIEQGCPNSVLEGRCPAEFSSNPN